MLRSKILKILPNTLTSLYVRMLTGEAIQMVSYAAPHPDLLRAL